MSTLIDWAIVRPAGAFSQAGIVLIRLRRGILLGAGLRERVGHPTTAPSDCDADRKAYGIDACMTSPPSFPALLARNIPQRGEATGILGRPGSARPTIRYPAPQIEDLIDARRRECNAFAAAISIAPEGYS